MLYFYFLPSNGLLSILLFFLDDIIVARVASSFGDAARTVRTFHVTRAISTSALQLYWDGRDVLVDF